MQFMEGGSVAAMGQGRVLGVQLISIIKEKEEEEEEEKKRRWWRWSLSSLPHHAHNQPL